MLNYIQSNFKVLFQSIPSTSHTSKSHLTNSILLAVLDYHVFHTCLALLDANLSAPFCTLTV